MQQDERGQESAHGFDRKNIKTSSFRIKSILLFFPHNMFVNCVYSLILSPAWRIATDKSQTDITIGGKYFEL